MKMDLFLPIDGKRIVELLPAINAAVCSIQFNLKSFTFNFNDDE
jgi:hypothetical protein